MSTTKSGSNVTHQQFGGQWTSRKLDVLAGYLQSYTTALKDKPTSERPFRKAYIDAFAGSGYRDARRAADESHETQSLLFPHLAGDEPQSLLDGSPRLANRVQIRQGDANEKIQQLCKRDWRSHRAVLFLDPYGLQVDWATIEAVAQTRAIDLWLLFPLGIGVNRLLTKSGDIPEEWRQRLNRLLGTEDWYDEFYSVESTPTLFETDQERLVKATMETIGRYFNNRLGQIFAGVAGEPGVLRNTKNNPLYLLCFAVGNESGKKVALRIAEHLLNEVC